VKCNEAIKERERKIERNEKDSLRKMREGSERGRERV
jgi:hypothetical protein